MQKWEYIMLSRARAWSEEEKGQTLLTSGWYESSEWENAVAGKVVSSNMPDLLKWFGEQGWELVAISARSGILGANRVSSQQSMDYAGFTDEEIWVFKRPKA